ncbi:MAG: OmpH family outer membrane protein [Gammaproteobacteria bacterium]|nr:OmpH family outer membrane protein [Gammaproteobacteria bacterium]
MAAVNFQKILREAPQAKASQELLDREFAPLQKLLKQQQGNVQTLHEKHLGLGPGTNPLKRASVEEQYKKAQEKLAETTRQYQTRLKLRMTQLRANFKRLLGKEIGLYARQHGITVVVNDGVAYAKSSLNITDEILALLKEDYRQAKAASAGKAQP